VSTYLPATRTGSLGALKSGTCFWIKDVSSGAEPGTFYGSGAARACKGTDAAGANLGQLVDEIR